MMRVHMATVLVLRIVQVTIQIIWGYPSLDDHPRATTINNITRMAILRETTRLTLEVLVNPPQRELARAGHLDSVYALSLLTL